MDVLEMPVTLIVKAPNQQIEDQTIQCELSWTIKKLKGYLSEVYPSKPRTEEQKVIYSGKLLHDSVVLKDVLRQYEGQETHTVHLVCTPPRDHLKPSFKMTQSPQTTKPSQPSGQNDDRSRQDNNNSSQNSPSSSRPVSAASSGNGHSNVRYRFPSLQPMNSQFPTPDLRALWAQAMRSYSEAAGGGSVDPNYMAQQATLMQQAYAQYVSQYMQLMQSGAFPQGTFIQPPVGMQPVVPPPTPAPAEPNQRNAQEAAPVVPPNNEAVVQEGEDEENRGNRDWIDWFYIISRFLVLFSIVYFYSSLTRLMIVTLLGILMYLYQVGFFRVQQVRRLENARMEEAAPNADRGDANAEQPPEVREQQPPQEQQQEGATPERPRDFPEEQVAAEERPVDPPQPSVLALTWTFFTSFFASLIPEQPNAI